MNRIITSLGLILGPIALLIGWLVLQFRLDDGPGTSWTFAHLWLLGGYAVLLGGALGLRRLLPTRSLVADVGALLAVVGALVFVGQMSIDLALGFASEDDATMSSLFDRVQGSTGMFLAYYAVGPALFYIGMLTLVFTLVKNRILHTWEWIPATIGMIAISVAFMFLGGTGTPIYGIGLALMTVGLASIGARAVTARASAAS